MAPIIAILGVVRQEVVSEFRVEEVFPLVAHGGRLVEVFRVDACRAVACFEVQDHVGVALEAHVAAVALETRGQMGLFMLSESCLSAGWRA